jgi:hypothetical protein
MRTGKVEFSSTSTSVSSQETGTIMERGYAPNSNSTQSKTPQQWRGLSRVLQFFFGGLFLASLPAVELAQLRGIHATWMLLVPLIFSVFEMFSLGKKKSASSSGQLIAILFLPFLVAAFYVRHQIWAPAYLALVFFTFWWLRFKATRSNCSVVLAGSLLAGAYPYWFQWPNEERCLLAIIGVGVSAMAQGLWMIVRCLWTGQPLTHEEATNPAQDERALLRAIHWMIGKIEHSQIFSSELIQRIQKRYNLEIGSLHGLGFSDGFYDAELSSAIRFLNPFLALVLLAMYLSREVITIEPGLKISNCHPVLLAPGHDSFAFGYVEGLGVGFFTSFSDGTLLVTKNHGKDDPSISDEVIVRRCKGASIEAAWANHQISIHELCESGKTVVRDMSYRAFAEVSVKEHTVDVPASSAASYDGGREVSYKG